MSRTLLEKLGIKAGMNVRFINEPKDYFQWLGEPLPENLAFQNEPLDFIHFFTNDIEDLESQLPQLQNSIVPNGMIWVSWYKKSAKLPSELDEDIIRSTALALKLVDIKVCSVSPQWSALKLVIRRELR
ncbi:DUF3052 domain-containing protein [Portibacter marinus]|uniref:DUF3052 domain-containing protein n=1 Tax=Portibacter marinus TaxID=2898660 RepID=UPI001F43BFC1|nr:DUF3052 domain-containing protein [Portibacter marinus]